MEGRSARRDLPRIVIVGGGFAGLAAARKLRDAEAEIVVVDRTNHHLFQPLLYQVATATLAPGDIASPIRKVLAQQKNATVVLADVEGVDPENRTLAVHLPSGKRHTVSFDSLVIATGARHSYFGHSEYSRYAPGLKALADATSIRARVLKAFELAETEPDEARRKLLLTFVLIGAGPTGVEMAGAIAELRRYTLRHEFRNIDPTLARILLVEASPRVLGSFHETLSQKALQRLQRLGVEVRVGNPVADVGPEHIVLSGETLGAHTIIWTAGVEPSPAAKWLNVEADRSGRVRVMPDCSVPGFPNIFVLGDTAYFETGTGPLPGVAQVALQQGRYAGKLIYSRLLNRPALGPFEYFDFGNMAVIGRNFAILERGGIRLSGYAAWLAWAFVHIAYLADYENRFRVLTQWAWTYFTKQGGSRLIVEPDV